MCVDAHVKIKDSFVTSLLSIFMWVLGVELRLPGIHGKDAYSLRFLTYPCVDPLREGSRNTFFSPNKKKGTNVMYLFLHYKQVCVFSILSFLKPAYAR